MPHLDVIAAAAWIQMSGREALLKRRRANPTDRNNVACALAGAMRRAKIGADGVPGAQII